MYITAFFVEATWSFCAISLVSPLLLVCVNSHKLLSISVVFLLFSFHSSLVIYSSSPLDWFSCRPSFPNGFFALLFDVLASEMAARGVFGVVSVPTTLSSTYCNVAFYSLHPTPLSYLTYSTKYLHANWHKSTLCLSFIPSSVGYTPF